MLPYQDEKIRRFRLVGNSGANTATSLEETASAGKTHVITGYSVVVGAAAVGAADVLIELKDGGAGGTVIWRDQIGAAAARGFDKTRFFPTGLPCAKGAAARLEVAAGGAAVVMSVNLHGYTIETPAPTA